MTYNMWKKRARQQQRSKAILEVIRGGGVAWMTTVVSCEHRQPSGSGSGVACAGRSATGPVAEGGGLIPYDSYHNQQMCVESLRILKPNSAPSHRGPGDSLSDQPVLEELEQFVTPSILLSPPQSTGNTTSLIAPPRNYRL